MTIDKLPSGPSRTDTVNFAARADALLAALPRFIDQVNALELANLIQGTEATAARDAAIAAWAASTAPAEQLAAVSQTIHSGAIVKAIVYDTSKDSDGGAWRKRCQHTSWYQEALGFTGKWLGQKASTAAAWATSGAAAGDGFQNTTDGKYYVLTGTSTASEIFRGNVREHPAMVLEVMSTTRLTVYDLTQPSCPMWRVFLNDANLLWSGSNTSVVAINGELCITAASTADTSGLIKISFLADSISGIRYSYYGPNSHKFLQPIVGGTVKTSALPFGTAGIVNALANDVAITVLDTAPTDPATGLPVPTIAVATAGGVSVIKDDGTVVNGASTVAAYGIAIDKLNRLKWSYYNHCAFSAPIQTLQAGFGGPLVLVTSGSVYGATTFPLTFNVSTATGKNTSDAFGGSGGFCRHIGDVPARTMAVGITNTYNSGWLPGDIRGAWLADTTAETISAGGVSYDFGTGIQGWNTGNGNSAISVAAGKLHCVISAAYGGTVSEGVPTVIGRTYTLTGEFTKTSLNCYFGAFTHPQASSGTLVQQSLTASGSYTLTFVATTATTYLAMYANGGANGDVFDLDNVALRIVEPDRCVKVKGLVVNGSLNKAAVASGAGLVAYSGFSASSYLEQPYNSDLDFGTGDFCMMGWESLAATAEQVIRIARGTVGGSRVGPYSAGTGTYYMSMLAAGGINSGVSQTLGWNLVAWVRESGVLKLYLNGALVFSVANTTNLTDSGAILRIGTDNGASPAWLGPQKMALWRITATAPSADQIAHIYRTELPLFQANAQCTIAGTSTAVTALAYDEYTTLLHVGTSWGRSSFKDLLRVDSEATTTGALTSLSAQGGVIVTGGTSAKVYMPALLLRDELRRKSEARRALGRAPVFFPFDAVTSQVAFAVPKGYTVKAVYSAGALKREGSTKDYTVGSDGFSETVTFAVAPGNGVFVSLMCVRA